MGDVAVATFLLEVTGMIVDDYASVAVVTTV